MSAVPRFFIVAGPNGAGKSSLGHAFLPPGVLFSMEILYLLNCVTNIQILLLSGLKVEWRLPWSGQEIKRWNKEKDFAFETNFSSRRVVDQIRLFRLHRYRIDLLYFGLPDLATSVSRENTRTVLGGHDIPIETTGFNLFEGIKLVNQLLA